jgi:hypothetical protein
VRGLQQYDVGAVVRVYVQDAGGATVTLDGTETATLLLELPSGRRKQFDATVDVDAQAVVYVTAPGDLDEWGDYRVQAYVASSDYDVRSAKAIMPVRSNLDAPRWFVQLEPAEMFLFAPVPFCAPAETGGSQAALEGMLAGEENLDTGYELVVNVGARDSTEYARAATDTTWVEDGPTFNAPWPRFVESAIASFDLVGHHALSAGSQQLEVELVVDDVPTGLVFALPNSTVTSTGWWRLKGDLQMDPGAGGTNVLRGLGEVRIYGDADAQISSTTPAHSLAFDPSVDHRLRWRVRNSVNLAGSSFQVRAWVWAWRAKRTGG